MQINWGNIGNLQSREFTCGYCNINIASERGYSGQYKGITVYLYQCHKCGRMNYFDEKSIQHPGSKFGSEVDDIDNENVKNLYDEARKCYAANSFTGSVLCCRKLLMNIAVSKGAKEGLKFIEYVEYLSNQNFIPPNGKEWVDHIRSKGNEATHEIEIMKKEDAEDLITFIEMLLKFIYEFPEKIKKRKNVTKPEEDNTNEGEKKSLINP